jgi:GT2 family glycosyltransferase
MRELFPPTRISIIMPCFNAALHLPRSFDSVLGQTYPYFELIAVDDGSRDGTLAWLQAQTDPRIRVISQPNRGVSAARNAGLAAAKGYFVAFLDADDTWAPNFLECMIGAFETDISIGLAYCGWQNIGLPGERGAPFIPPDYEVPDKKAILIANNRWPIHACLTTRELVLASGGFDPRFAIGEDFLLWLEIGCFRHIRRVPAVLAYYFHHNGVQATRDQVRATRQVRDVQKAFLQRHPEVISELGRTLVRELTDGRLLLRAYDAYWHRDLATAQPIFRLALRAGGWKLRDLRYLLPSLLPGSLYRRLIKLSDARQKKGSSK